MPNMIGQTEAKQNHNTQKNGAEITDEMQRRLMLGEKPDVPAEKAEVQAQGDTVAGRAAAAKSAG